MQALFIFAGLLLAIQVIPLYAETEVNCPPGQVFVDDACQPCPAGTYRAANTSNTCTRCRTGTFNPIQGAGARTLCLFCDVNTFSDEFGSPACKPCPDGTVATRGASRCRACGPGFRVFFDRCDPCSETTFNDKNATLECTSCPSSLTSPEQSTSISDCTTCPPGQFASRGIGCRSCLEGTFKPGRLGRCQQCPPGSFAKAGWTACRLCRVGTFSRRRFAKRCEPCREGTMTNGRGATRCRAIGSTRCPSNTFEKENGDCDSCRFNFRYNKENKLCEPCPAGSVSKGGLQTECTTCPPGQSADPFNIGAGCTCPQGMFRKKDTCKPCPPGTGGNFINVTGKRGCITCGLGFFSDRPGSTRCKKCPFNTFSDSPGATRCKRCPRGSVASLISLSSFSGSTRCVSITTGCRLGFQAGRDVFGRLKCQRVDCPVGTPEKDIGIKCLPCSPGFRLVGDKCERCPQDSVSDGGVITSCTKCENGLVRSFFDDSKCACDGEVGTGKGIQDGVCKDCPPGSVGSPNFSKCAICPPGRFTSGFGNQFCNRCPKGTFSDEPGSASCKTCPSGTVPEKITASKECLPTT